MKRRDFLKATATPIVLGALGFSLTPDQTTIDRWQFDDPSVLDKFMPGDILHVPQTAENIQVVDVTSEGLVLERRFGGSPGGYIADDDSLWLLGSAEKKGKSTVRHRFKDWADEELDQVVFRAGDVPIKGGDR